MCVPLEADLYMFIMNNAFFQVVIFTLYLQIVDYCVLFVAYWRLPPKQNLHILRFLIFLWKPEQHCTLQCHIVL